MHLGRANLTDHEFFLTHNVLHIHGHSYSFRVKQPLVCMDTKYHKVKDWSPKFFFASGPWLGPFEGRADHCELSIWSIWGEVPEDRVIHFSPSQAEEKHIAIVAEWMKSHVGDFQSEVLLSEKNIRIFLSPYGGVSPSSGVIPTHLGTAIF